MQILFRQEAPTLRYDECLAMVVRDTNINFSAITHSAGPPFRIWRRTVKRDFALLVSAAIL